MMRPHLHQAGIEGDQQRTDVGFHFSRGQKDHRAHRDHANNAQCWFLMGARSQFSISRGRRITNIWRNVIFIITNDIIYLICRSIGLSISLDFSKTCRAFASFIAVCLLNSSISDYVFLHVNYCLWQCKIDTLPLANINHFVLSKNLTRFQPPENQLSVIRSGG